MLGSSKVIDDQNQQTPAIKLEGVDIRLIRLPLVEPFETSFGKIDSRLIFLVCLQANGMRGWGEVVASEQPLYSYETVGTAFHVIRDFLGPALLSAPLYGLDDLATRLGPFRGHYMARGLSWHSWTCWPQAITNHLQS
jgi:O-succinylbenzoate synthase